MGSIEIETLQGELDDLRNRIELLEEEKMELWKRGAIAEQELQKAANLYVSTQMLFTASTVSALIETVQEIICNLIGSEDFGIFSLDEGRTDLAGAKLIGEGVASTERDHDISPWREIIEEVVQERKLSYSNEASEEIPCAVIPIELNEETVGLVIIYKLLPQKISITNTDVEILTLLSRCLGIALLAVTADQSGSVAAELRSTLQSSFTRDPA